MNIPYMDPMGLGNIWKDFPMKHVTVSFFEEFEEKICLMFHVENPSHSHSLWRGKEKLSDISKIDFRFYFFQSLPLASKEISIHVHKHG